MGLFDKFKSAIDTAAAAINKSIESSQNAKDPLQDEIVKKYYDIIYDMRMSRGWFGKEIADLNSRAKRYVELVLGGACDVDRFVKAVELINLSNTDHPNTNFEKQMVDYRKSLYQEYKAREYESAYGFDIKTICEACYAELLAEIKSKYEAMLNVIDEDESCEYFEDGLKKYVLDKYRDTQDLSVVKDCLCVAIMDSFFEGNETTKEVVFELLESEEDESLSESIDLKEIATVVYNFINR